MTKMRNTVYRELFDEVFKEVYSKKRHVEKSDMVVPYDRAVAFFMESGRGEKAARDAIRELMKMGLFADNGDGTLLLVRNDYGVELPSLEVCEVTDTIRIKKNYTELPKDLENPTYVGTTLRKGEVLHTCCSVMEDNIKKGKVKVR